MRVSVAVLLVVASLSGCEAEAPSNIDTGLMDDDDDGDGVPSAVTLGVYELVDDSYEDRNRDLVMEFGVGCHTWSRSTQRADDFSQEPHEHYNAADAMTYDETTFTWTEYGPEHSQGDIEATCGDGVGGTAKSATWTEYVEEPPGSGAWLRIKDVTY